MGAIGFYIFYGINWVITLLPMRILYVSFRFSLPDSVLCSEIQEESGGRKPEEFVS